METKYSFKGGGKEWHGITAEQVATEFERLNSIYGEISPNVILGEAEKTGSILHPFFQWDDAEAAKQHRLQQARQLVNSIEITVVSNGEERQIGAYEITKVNDKKTYKNVESMDVNDIAFVKQSIRTELLSIQRKLSYYDKLKKTAKFVKKAEESLHL